MKNSGMACFSALLLLQSSLGHRVDLSETLLAEVAGLSLGVVREHDFEQATRPDVISTTLVKQRAKHICQADKSLSAASCWYSANIQLIQERRGTSNKNGLSDLCDARGMSIRPGIVNVPTDTTFSQSYSLTVGSITYDRAQQDGLKNECFLMVLDQQHVHNKMVKIWRYFTHANEICCSTKEGRFKNLPKPSSKPASNPSKPSSTPVPEPTTTPPQKPAELDYKTQDCYDIYYDQAKCDSHPTDCRWCQSSGSASNPFVCMPIEKVDDKTCPPKAPKAETTVEPVSTSVEPVSTSVEPVSEPEETSDNVILPDTEPETETTLADDSSQPVETPEEALEKKEEPTQMCDLGETYGLDSDGKCHPDVNNDGVLDVKWESPEACCLACHPGEDYQSDKNGRCRTDINKNGIFDRFANEVCCSCDATRQYGRDSAGRCRTDVNSNGVLDRFAKSMCCADKSQYAEAAPKSTHKYKHPVYGLIDTEDDCKSKGLMSVATKQVGQMSSRNKGDCIACLTSGAKGKHHPDRCV